MFTLEFISVLHKVSNNQVEYSLNKAFYFALKGNFTAAKRELANIEYDPNFEGFLIMLTGLTESTLKTVYFEKAKWWFKQQGNLLYSEMTDYL
ncbi:hypothetical protein LC087_12485 [Bacillus carboniphilus]|uniref:Uncharacterized protein n=1 Tax=Bacillus carboniphilus TaxID=86663 RepID=A0ABY9JQL3_9BACI|nr:hypothetical protein [Bacillus carboniphilus]WLR41681.1 hypothetical protein LC087_12485 [Bacillus carboniphilus]